MSNSQAPREESRMHALRLLLRVRKFSWHRTSQMECVGYGALLLHCSEFAWAVEFRRLWCGEVGDEKLRPGDGKRRAVWLDFHDILRMARYLQLAPSLSAGLALA